MPHPLLDLARYQQPLAFTIQRLEHESFFNLFLTSQRIRKILESFKRTALYIRLNFLTDFEFIVVFPLHPQNCRLKSSDNEFNARRALGQEVSILTIGDQQMEFIMDMTNNAAYFRSPNRRDFQTELLLANALLNAFNPQQIHINVNSVPFQSLRPIVSWDRMKETNILMFTINDDVPVAEEDVRMLFEKAKPRDELHICLGKHEVDNIRLDGLAPIAFDIFVDSGLSFWFRREHLLNQNCGLMKVTYPRALRSSDVNTFIKRWKRGEFQRLYNFEIEDFFEEQWDTIIDGIEFLTLDNYMRERNLTVNDLPFQPPSAEEQLVMIISDQGKVASLLRRMNWFTDHYQFHTW